MSRIHKQKGVALLVVLILLVMMSALAAKISQQFCRNLQKTHYQVSQQQLRWAMLAQEKVVKDRLQTDASGESKPLSLDGDWHQPLETRGEDYTVVSQVEDAQPTPHPRGKAPPPCQKNRVKRKLLSNC